MVQSEGTLQQRYECMATITERVNAAGKKAYRVRIRRTGFPDQTASFKSKTEARRWETTTEAAILEGRHFVSQKSKKHPLADAINRYLDDNLPLLSTSEQGNRTRHLEYWNKHLGKMTLAQLCNDAEPIRQLKKQLSRSNTSRGTIRSPGTVNRYHASLSKLFTTAMRWGWASSNPMKLIEKAREPDGRERYLSDDERARLLLATKVSKDPYLDICVKLALTTGGRYSEILGLTWSNVSLERQSLTFRNTKNRESRTVALVEPAKAAVTALYESRRVDTDLLFAWSKPDRPKNIRRGWANALEAAGIEDFNFHDLRHTCASYLAMSGATSSELAAVLGHKTLAMVKRYSHVSEVHTMDLVKRMAEQRFGAEK